MVANQAGYHVFYYVEISICTLPSFELTIEMYDNTFELFYICVLENLSFVLSLVAMLRPHVDMQGESRISNKRAESNRRKGRRVFS